VQVDYPQWSVERITWALRVAGQAFLVPGYGEDRREEEDTIRNLLQIRCLPVLRWNATDVAFRMMNISDFAHCDDCAIAALRRLDFSYLSTSALMKHTLDVDTGRRIPHIGREIRRIHPMGAEVPSASRVSANRNKRAASRKKGTDLDKSLERSAACHKLPPSGCLGIVNRLLAASGIL
jgi:hypothetical protein